MLANHRRFKCYIFRCIDGVQSKPLISKIKQSCFQLCGGADLRWFNDFVNGLFSLRNGRINLANRGFDWTATVCSGSTFLTRLPRDVQTSWADFHVRRNRGGLLVMGQLAAKHEPTFWRWRLNVRQPETTGCLSWDARTVFGHVCGNRTVCSQKKWGLLTRSRDVHGERTSCKKTPKKQPQIT